MAKPQTLHDLTAVSIDASRNLVLVKGTMANADAIALHLHRRTLAALIASLIRAHEQFPRPENQTSFPSQPLKLSGAATIALGDEEPVLGLELLLGDGLNLRIIIPEAAAKPLRQCIDALIAFRDSRPTAAPY